MILQLTYASRPFGYDSAMLTGILFDARRCNTRDGITGALICRNDLFLQLLEGPEAAVEATFARIAADDRHIEVRRLTRRMIPGDERMFGAWAMRDDPAASWVWSRAEVEAGVPEQASEAEVLAMFRRLPPVNLTGQE
jgi:Sensors of blue-light using FAD